MPRDLFGDVTRPSISIGNRKWYTVPVSLLSHGLILATVIIAPILAAPFMPGVSNSDIVSYMPTVMPPPPPPPALRTQVKPVANPNAAPTVAPSTIEPEKPFDFESVETLPVGVIGDPGSVNVALAPPPVVVAPPPPQPVQVGGTIRRPVKVSGSDPVYSPFARAAGLQGIVIIEATIGADGRMMNARVLRSVHQLLDQAALDAVRTWEYTPTLLNGVPVPVIMTVTVTFMLSR